MNLYLCTCRECEYEATIGLSDSVELVAAETPSQARGLAHRKLNGNLWFVGEYIDWRAKKLKEGIKKPVGCLSPHDSLWDDASLWDK